MKKLPFLFFLGLGASFANAQSLDPEVIGSAGDFNETTIGSLSWTIGEPITETIGNSDYTLTQGFQQTKFTIVGIEESPENLFNIQVYPNPAIQFFEIELNATDLSHSFQYEMYDQNGRIMRSGIVNNEKTRVELNGMANSVYFLKVWSTSAEYHKIYQVLKIK